MECVVADVVVVVLIVVVVVMVVVVVVVVAVDGIPIANLVPFWCSVVELVVVVDLWLMVVVVYVARVHFQSFLRMNLKKTTRMTAVGVQWVVVLHLVPR